MIDWLSSLFLKNYFNCVIFGNTVNVLGIDDNVETFFIKRCRSENILIAEHNFLEVVLVFCITIDYRIDYMLFYMLFDDFRGQKFV